MLNKLSLETLDMLVANIYLAFFFIRILIEAKKNSKILKVVFNRSLWLCSFAYMIRMSAFKNVLIAAVN